MVDEGPPSRSSDLIIHQVGHVGPTIKLKKKKKAAINDLHHEILNF